MIADLWVLKQVKHVPVVSGTLEAMTGNILKWLCTFGTLIRNEIPQKTTLLGAGIILRKVL